MQEDRSNNFALKRVKSTSDRHAAILTGMTIDERIEALTQSVELLASMHKDHEKRLARMESALTAAAAAFIQEWTRKDRNGEA